MAYFLGRDVELAITTEHNNLGIVFEEHASNADELAAVIVDFTHGTSVNIYATAEKANLFAGPRAAVSASEGPWGDITPGNTTTNFTSNDSRKMVNAEWNNEPDNLTAIDISMGVMDEDVAFIGQRNVLKAEVKKENTISITRKKKDAMFETVYNSARFGLASGQTVCPASPFTSGLFDGLSAPDYSDCGYRVYLRFKDSSTADEGEIFVLRNCYITEHSVSMGADSTQEETLTLMSYVDPIVATGAEVSHANGSNALIEATPTSEL
jgi:hypothetical protein